MEMIVMGAEGDTKFWWDTTDPEEVRQAEDMFNLYRNQGFAVFACDETGPALTEFDSNAGTMVFVPMMAGG